MADTQPKLLIENDGAVRTLRLNRPDSLNAFDNELLAALARAVADAELHGIALVEEQRRFGHARFGKIQTRQPPREEFVHVVYAYGSHGRCRPPGTAWNDQAASYCPVGGTGSVVRTLLDYLAAL